MGLLSDDYYKQLRQQSTPVATPTQPAPDSRPLVQKAEETVLSGVEAESEQRIKNLESQASSALPSQETLRYHAEHPILSFFGRSLGETIGIKFPDQNTWDQMSATNKLAYLGPATLDAGARMLVRAPREIVKAPIRLAYSITKPWADLAAGKPATLDSIAGDKPLKLPWIGEVPSYFHDFKQACDSGLGPAAASLMTGATALGDATIAASLLEAVQKAFQPRAQIAGKPIFETEPIKQTLAAEKAGMRVVGQAEGSAAEYYSLPKTVAKKYGGNSSDTFLKVTPANVVGENSVEIAVVQTRGGVLQKTADFIKGRGEKIYQGDFGPETKFESQIVPVGKAKFLQGQAETKLTPETKAVQPAENITPILPGDINQYRDEIVRSLELAEPGQRIFQRDAAGYLTGEVVGQKSTFPEWIPPELRKSSLVKAVADHINKNTLPTKAGEIRLYNAVAEEMGLVKRAKAEVDADINNLPDFAREAEQLTQKYDAEIRGLEKEIKSGEIQAGISETANVPKTGEPAATPAPVTPEDVLAALSESEKKKVLAAVLPKALKGFENKPVTADQLTHISQIAAINNVDSSTAQAIIRSLTGKSVSGELTQSEYVQISQTLAALNDLGKYNPGMPSVNVFSQYGSPQRYWMRTYEEKSGIPLYSEVYVPMEDAVRLRNVFRDSYRSQSREIYGKYANPGFAEERRLIKAYMEGDTRAVTANETLKPEVKADLVKIAEQMRLLYDKLGTIFDIPTEVFLKDYQPHIQNVGGVYQLYKEGSVIPKELTFFAEFKRRGALSSQVDDALALFDIYVNAGSNKKFLNPALERISDMGEKLPATLQNSVKSYVGEKLGYAGRVEQYLNEIGVGINRKLGTDLPPDLGRQVTQYIMDTTYSGALGIRPGAIIRNLMQSPLISYPRLGPKFYAQAVAKSITKEGVKEVADKGFLVELGLPYGEELTKEVGLAGRVGTLYRNVTQATLKPYAAADTFTRGQTYWQGKYIWDDALARYSSGKITWEQFEKDVDLSAMSAPDRNIIRQRMIDGDQGGAFDQYIRDIIDETQFPYRRGASSRVTYGFAGRLGTQFGQWNIEFAHTLGRWVKTGQWDKLVRFYAAAAASKRTMEDTFGFDISKWVGLNAIDPTLSPFAQFGSELASLVQNFRDRNDEEMQKNADNLAREVKSLGMPAGVQTNNWKDFWRSYSKGPVGPDGQYGVYDSRGKLKYWAPFKDIWWDMWGFASPLEKQYQETATEMRNARFDYSRAKKKILELYQQEKFDQANELIKDYGVQLSPADFDAYYIPLNQRTFDSLPAILKPRFAPQVFK